MTRLPACWKDSVALRKESVDRNGLLKWSAIRLQVALRKESVDRNVEREPFMTDHNVALRKESVDRNWFWDEHVQKWRLSLSARRAWIEIGCGKSG